MDAMPKMNTDVSGGMRVTEKDNRFDIGNLFRLNIPNGKELFQRTYQSIRPWIEFMNTVNFKPAASMPRLTNRFVRNLSYFQSNYIVVFIVLMIYCLITSPLILIVLFASAFLSHKIKQAHTSVTIYGHEVTPSMQILGLTVALIPVLFLVGAGSALFWTLGASCFFIFMHATFYNIDAIVTEDAETFLSEVI